MGTPTIRNLDDRVIERRKAQARELASATAGTSQTDSAILLREDRDR